MRADRLVAILMLLQTRGQVTAAEVAGELEISERTARRDLEALGMAGLPVYSTQGRNGGWRLAGGGRTDLSGLTADETRALFMLASPQAVSPEVKAALRKLVRALPEPFRPVAERASNALVVDAAGWGGVAAERRSPVFLEALQRAVVDGQQVVLGYVARDQQVTSRTVHPLGLAAKGAHWYLVAATDAGQRTFRVDRVQSVEPTGQPVQRPDDFDLTSAWRTITDEVDRMRAPVEAWGTATPAAIGILRFTVGTRLHIGPPGADGRVQVAVRGNSEQALAGELAGFGAMFEVLGPPEVRAELARVGEELRRLYGAPS